MLLSLPCTALHQNFRIGDIWSIKLRRLEIELNLDKLINIEESKQELCAAKYFTSNLNQFIPEEEEEEKTAKLNLYKYLQRCN